MAGNELATAYLTLVPSLKGAKASIAKQLGGIDTTGAGKQMGDKASSGFGSGFASIKGIATAIATSAGVAACASFVKSAVGSYADYEQLVGGVDTLFKENSAALQAYAANAYQTAGMSANQYMELSTSFAASLLQSLGGDTAAAVEYANMAITDMSDNANKMGTDIGRITDAYQGFAKQNFTMLDNLKLGYGGTKEEMQRLLEDATALSGIEYDLSSYSDIVDAIHVIQTEMGITGTTALEASETISGSVASMKAQWSNWLTALADENANLEEQTQRLVESVVIVLENVTPVAVEVTSSMGEALASYAPEAAQRLYEALMSSLPESVSGPVRAAVEKLGEISAFIGETFGPGIQTAMTYVSPILQNVGDLFSSMGGKVQEVLVPALDFLGERFTAAMEAVEPWIEPLGNVAELFGNILVAAISAAAYTFGLILGVFEVVTGVIFDFDAFMNGQPSIIGTAIDGMVEWFKRFPGQVWTWLCEAIDEIVVWGSNMIAEGKSAASRFVDSVISTITSLPGKVASYAGQMATAAFNMVYGMVSGITSAGGAVWSAITRICSNSLGAIKSYFGIASPSKVMREMFGYVGEGMALGLEDKSDRVVGAMKSVADGAMDAASMTVTPSSAGGSDLASALRIALEDVNITAQTYLDGRNVSDAIAEYLDSVNGGRQRMANRGLAL